MSRSRCLTVVVGLLLAFAAPALAGESAASVGQWRLLLKVPGIVDVVGPRADGQLVLSTNTGLFLLRPGRTAQPFANASTGYTAGGGEPYVALSTGARVWGVTGCSFAPNELFALDAGAKPGVFRVSESGQSSRFVEFPAGVFPSGIAFDRFGRYGYRLLVTATAQNMTTLYAIDCLGRVSVILQGGPLVEGGIVVAPRSFGSFGGQLIAADEFSGTIYAFRRNGTVAHVADSGLPAGADIGIESLGFVPSTFGPGGAVYFSDFGAPGSPTEGNDSLQVLRGQDLSRAALRSGELLAAMEGGGTTIAVRCEKTCTVRRVADGVPGTHGEGHLTFVAGTTTK